MAGVSAALVLCNFNLGGVFLAKGQFISTDPNFDWVAHRRHLDNAHLCARNQAHIQKTQPQRTFTTDGLYVAC